MFENVGRKIKILAKIMCGIGICLSLIFSIMMLSVSAASTSSVSAAETTNRILGAVYLLVGPLVSYILSSLMYGFGELIETNSIIAETNTTIAYNIQNK